jgi:hypothetical protein
VTGEIFDMTLRALRRDRAARQGPELFLLDRAFDDIVGRLSLINRSFESVLLLGCPSADWPRKVRAFCERIDILDPGPRFAEEAGGRTLREPDLPVTPGSYDLILSVGTLDTVNDLTGTLLRLRFALQPGGVLLGAISGGATIPQLRAAMRAADESVGIAAPHVHPRIDPSALAGLLDAAGFKMPVVDVDRVNVAYSSLGRLIADLRRMGATNVLKQRSKMPVGRRALSAAEQAFTEAGDGQRTVEIFEILHFAAWAEEPQETAADQG